MTDLIPDHDISARRVLAAIALGQTTAATIATTAEVAYSTTNKKLRLLKGAGLAISSPGPDTKLHWQLTDAGHAYAMERSGHGDMKNPDTSAPVAAEVAGALPIVPVAGDPDPAPASHEGCIGHSGAASGDLDNHSTGTADSRDDPAGADAGVTGADNAVAGTDTAPLDTEPPAAVPATTAAPDNPPTRPQQPESHEQTSSEAIGESDKAVPRRRKGALHNEVITVLQTNPDRTFTVTQVCKQIDAIRQGTGSAKASHGAVYNALFKAVCDGVARQVVERPATFQAN